MSMLEAQGITVRFSGIVALDGLSFDIDAGPDLRPHRTERRRQDDAVQRRQPRLRPDEGALRFDGDDLLTLPPHRIATAGIARTFQNLALFPTMTVLENVMVGAHTCVQGQLGHRRRCASASAARSAASRIWPWRSSTSSAWPTLRCTSPRACPTAR